MHIYIYILYIYICKYICTYVYSTYSFTPHYIYTYYTPVTSGLQVDYLLKPCQDNLRGPGPGSYGSESSFLGEFSRRRARSVPDFMSRMGMGCWDFSGISSMNMEDDWDMIGI